MWQALNIGRSILALGEAVAPLFVKLVDVIKGHDVKTQRAAMDAAFAAAEERVLQSIWKKR